MNDLEYDISAVEGLIDAALKEDLGDAGDVTSISLVNPQDKARAVILAKEACVISGVPVAMSVFRKVDPTLEVNVVLPDGSAAVNGASILEIYGSIQSILTAERTALNFMQRLTGIATLTRTFVDCTTPYGTKILDTRKTTPAMRTLEKYAVKCGGGINHRMGLYDRILIKDNHRKLWNKDTGKDLADAVCAAREKYPELIVEVEVETEDELLQVLPVKPEWILLDNMKPDELMRCVQICSGKSQLEASGGINLANIQAVAASGVDAVSLGCLTHSAPSADLSLELELD